MLPSSLASPFISGVGISAVCSSLSISCWWVAQVLKDGLIRSATSNQDNMLRYFNHKETEELLSLPEENFRGDKTLRLMEEKHKGEVKL